MRAMIFAAGLGTRLRPLTDTMPKALVPVAGKPLLHYQIQMLRQAGISDIVINVHHFAQMIIDEVHRNNDFGCHITFSDERDLLLNTGGGLCKAIEDGLFGTDDEPILALNVDILSNINLQQPEGRATARRACNLLVVSDRVTQRYLCFDEANRLVGWTNIATGEERGCMGQPLPSTYRRLAFSGMSILRPSTILPTMLQLKKTNPVFSLIDLFLAMPAGSFEAYVPADYRMMDVGKIDQLSQADSFLYDCGNLGF